MNDKTNTTETDERAKSYTECLAFPEEIPKDMQWTPEADMLMQVNESILQLDDTLSTIAVSMAGILKILEQASEVAGEYIAKQTL